MARREMPMDDYVEERAPAANIEHHLIGALLSDRDAIVAVAGQVNLTADHFRDPGARAAYSAILRMYERRDPADLASVSAELEAAGVQHPDTFTLTSWMSGLYGAGYAVHAPTYAAQVKRAAGKRALIAAFTEQLKALHTDPEHTAADALAAMTRAVDGDEGESGPRSLADLLPETVQIIGEERSGARQRDVVPLGFVEIDRVLGGGLGRGDLCALAARSGLGKTALASSMLYNAARLTGLPGIMFSMEMGADAMMRRTLSRESGIDMYDVKTARLSDDDWTLLQETADAAANVPVWLDVTPGITTDQMRARANRLMAETGQRLSLIVIDYLELVGDGQENERVPEQVRISRIVSRAKFMARTCECPVILLCQVQREVDSKAEKMPMLHHIAWSSMIEKAADQVILFTVPDHYVNQGVQDYDPLTAGKVDILLAKHRNGDKGRFKLDYTPETMAYHDEAPAGVDAPWYATEEIPF